MDVHLNNPDLQAKLDRWVTETGRGPDELVEDAMAGYFDELASRRENKTAVPRHGHWRDSRLSKGRPDFKREAGDRRGGAS